MHVACPPPIRPDIVHVCCDQVTFDAHSDAELLQVLNDVFAKLDERNKVDLRDEDPAVTGPRLMNFLRIVKFNVPAAER